MCLQQTFCKAISYVRVIGKVMSTYEIWMPVLNHYESLAPNIWLDYSVLNFILMKSYYSHYPDVLSGYLDTSFLNVLDADHDTMWRVKAFAIPRFRQRSFLPIKGPCSLQPKVFVIRQNENHFFVVYMDHAHRSVTVFGRTSNAGRDLWEEWDGPKIYHNICVLHGWDTGSTGDVTVKSVAWEMNGFDCGPIAILVVQYLLSEALSERGIRVLTSMAQSCHHSTRIGLFQSLRPSIRDSISNYIYHRSDPPEEWLTWSLGTTHPTYEPLSISLVEAHQKLQSDKSPILQELNTRFSGCVHCRRNTRPMPELPLSQNQSAPCLSAPVAIRTGSPEISVSAHPFDRGEPHSIEDSNSVDDPSPSENPSPLDVFDDALMENSRTRRLHLVKANWAEMNIERKRRISRPCDLPFPSSPLWPPYDKFYDDYFGGPTQEDLHAFEDPYHALPLYDPILSSVHFKSPWTYFRDYGYRLLSRFAHAYYMGPPMLLENHVMPLIPEIRPEAYKKHFRDMHLTPKAISRTGIPELRVVSSGDIEILGAKEMLDRVESEDGDHDSHSLISHFLRGRNNEENYLCVDLEKDALPSSNIKINLSMDVDSFVFVTDVVKVAAAVSLMVIPSLGNNAGIKKHNHVYVEILDPPTDLEALNPSQRSWLERRVPLSHIPHTLFAKITEGDGATYCHIFFPRMIHRAEYTKKRATYLPPEILAWFWNNVILPALRDEIGRAHV